MTVRFRNGRDGAREKSILPIMLPYFKSRLVVVNIANGKVHLQHHLPDVSAWAMDNEVDVAFQAVRAGRIQPFYVGFLTVSKAPFQQAKVKKNAP